MHQAFFLYINIYTVTKLTNQPHWRQPGLQIKIIPHVDVVVKVLALSDPKKLLAD